MKKKHLKTLKRLLATALAATVTVNTCIMAYAEEKPYEGIVNEAYENTGFKYLIQCENYSKQSSSGTIDGEVIETEKLATLHDGIMTLLGEDAIISTSDYISGAVISNKTDVYSSDTYNIGASIINLSEVIVAENTIGISSSQVNGEGAVLYSKNGDINIYTALANFTGIIYAPNGTVRLQGSDITVNGAIIAKQVEINATVFNVKHNAGIAETVDNLDYIEMARMAGLSAVYDEESKNITLQWDEDNTIASVDVYARYGTENFVKVDTTTESEYSVSSDLLKTNADYRVVLHTKYGEEIPSNIITFTKTEDGIYEDVTDTDEDGIPDGYEHLIGTDAYNADTDRDGFDDGYEANILCTNPEEYNNDVDSDGDGVTNLEEYSLGTNPYLKDSDFDGLSDSEDIAPMKSDTSTGKEVDYTVPVHVGLFDLVTKYVNENSKKCEIICNYLNGQAKYMSNSENQSYNIYNSENQLTAAIENVDGKTIANTYSYDGDNIETITHNGFQYGFTYDEVGNMTEAKVGDRTLISNEYEDGVITTESYGNGKVNQYIYDELGNIIGQSVNGHMAYQWEYDENRNVISYADLYNNQKYTYTYDEEGNVTEIEGSDGFKISYYETENTYAVTYENAGQIKTQQVTYAEEKIEATTEEATGTVTTTNLISGGKLVSVAIGENALERTLYVGDKSVLGTKYTTSENGISKIEYQDGKVLEYQYDDCGNIVFVRENGDEKASYQYDSLGQLVRENNLYAGRTLIYTYDNAGNILESREYEYTTEQPSECIAVKTYEYDDKDWKDLLTSFNGQQITYDEIGNPLSYRDDMKFTWDGRQLVSIQKGEDVVSYTYNSNGIRTSKTVDGVTTTYQLEGNKIISETTEGVVTWYIYDENDSVVGFESDSKVYYYEKNAQGDVVRIFDEAGSFVCEYTYDAWGNITSIAGDEEVAGINSFRYRGYYQDNETGFYYLQSRYYDGYTGRFLNADDVYFLHVAQCEILSTNIYMYCGNNPINYCDPLGQWLIQLICGITGAVTFGTIANKLCTLLGVNSTAKGLITAGFAILGGVLGAAFGPGVVGKVAPKVLDWVKNLEKVINRKSKLRPMLFEGHVAIGWEWNKKIKVMLHFTHAGEPEKGMHITIQHYTGKNWRKSVPDIPIKSLGKVFINWVKNCLK